MREMFNESQLISELEKIGNNLKRRIKMFQANKCSRLAWFFQL